MTNSQTVHTMQNKQTDIWATRTPLKSWGDLRCSGTVSRSCSNCEYHRVAYISTNLFFSIVLLFDRKRHRGIKCNKEGTRKWFFSEEISMDRDFWLLYDVCLVFICCSIEHIYSNKKKTFALTLFIFSCR